MSNMTTRQMSIRPTLQALYAGHVPDSPRTVEALKTLIRQGFLIEKSCVASPTKRICVNGDGCTIEEVWRLADGEIV